MLFLAIVIMALFQMVGIASILPFMQMVSEPEVIAENTKLQWVYEQFGFDSVRSMLIATGVAVFVLITVGNVISAFTGWLQFKYAWRIAHNISTRLLRNYLSQPYDYFLKTNTSNLLNKTVVEVVQLTTGVIIPLIELAARSLIVLVIFGLLVWVNPQLALVVLGVLGLAYVLIYASTRRFLSRIGAERIDANERLMSSLNEALTGIKTLRVYDAEKLFYKRFESASSTLIKIHPNVKLVSGTPRYLIELLAFGGILGITLFLLITEGDLKSVLPLLSLYALAGYRLLPALQNAFSAAATLRHFLPVLDGIYEDLNMDAQPYLSSSDPSVQKSLAPLRQQITLENLSFRYEDTTQTTLENLNVKIQKGKTIAFVGATGSGKTTLVNLIVGLLEPQHGTIYIDDVALTRSNTRAWNRQIGYVPQDVFLFDDTVLRNIAIGQKDEEIDLARVQAAARLARIHDFISEELSDGYQNIIGDRGVRLSGGQRQRLGLARALYRNPELLILDEATSALDNITEHAVIQSLKQAARNLTVIIIAHRLSTVKHADCIYLLKAGQIIAKGSYNELLDTNEIFREMVQHS